MNKWMSEWSTKVLNNPGIANWTRYTIPTYKLPLTYNLGGDGAMSWPGRDFLSWGSRFGNVKETKTSLPWGKSLQTWLGPAHHVPSPCSLITQHLSPTPDSKLRGSLDHHCSPAAPKEWMNDGWPRGRGSPPHEAAHGCTWREKVPDQGDGATEFLGFWLIHLNPPLRLSPDPAYERRGEWAECLWRQPCGERMGHHTPRVQAANPGAVQLGQEEAQLWPPHWRILKKRAHRCGDLIPEGENRTRIRGGGLGREVIKRQVSAKKEQLFYKTTAIQRQDEEVTDQSSRH